jgi:hypothetical protein
VGTISFFVQQRVSAHFGELFIGLLKEAYGFLLGYSLALVLLFQVLAHYRKQVHQLGFLYLVFLFLKILVFAVLFNPFFLGDRLLPMPQRAALLVPALIFLALEVFFIAKIMQRIEG